MTKDITQIQFSDKFLILRAVLCLIVFGTHIPKQLWNIKIGYTNFNISFLFSGHLAVVIFMILSGYLIGKQFYNNKYDSSFAGFRKYVISRIKRIVPIYYISIVVGLVFASSEFWQDSNWMTKLIQSFLFVYDIDSKPYFVNGFWSLSVEMQFYLVAPVIFWILDKLYGFKFYIGTEFLNIKNKVCMLYFNHSKFLNYSPERHPQLDWGSKRTSNNHNLKSNILNTNNTSNIVFIKFTLFSILIFLCDLLIRRFVVPSLEVSQLKHFLIHFSYLIFGMSLNFISLRSIYLLKKFDINKRVYCFWAIFGFILVALIDQNYRSIQNYKDTFDGFIFIYFLSVVSGFLILLAETINSQKKYFSQTNNTITGILEKLGLISYPFYLIHLIVIKSLPIQTPFFIVVSFGISVIVSYFLERLSKLLFTQNSAT